MGGGKICRYFPKRLAASHRAPPSAGGGGPDIGGEPAAKGRAATLVPESARAPRRGAGRNSRPWGINAILARTAGRLSSSIAGWTALATGRLSNGVAARTAHRAA